MAMKRLNNSTETLHQACLNKDQWCDEASASANDQPTFAALFCQDSPLIPCYNTHTNQPTSQVQSKPNVLQNDNQIVMSQATLYDKL
jgi:hypothetical protein